MSRDAVGRGGVYGLGGFSTRIAPRGRLCEAKPWSLDTKHASAREQHEALGEAMLPPPGTDGENRRELGG